MFFLVRGLISVEKMALDEATKEWKDIQIANLKAGSYFGELALLRKGTLKICFQSLRNYIPLLYIVEIIVKNICTFNHFLLSIVVLCNHTFQN